MPEAKAAVVAAKQASETEVGRLGGLNKELEGQVAELHSQLAVKASVHAEDAESARAIGLLSAHLASEQRAKQAATTHSTTLPNFCSSWL